MKKTLIVMLSFLSWNVSGQMKNYAADGQAVKTYAEYCVLEISDSDVKYPPPPASAAADKGRSTILPILAAILPSVFSLGEKLITNGIKKNLKRYVAEYSARQTLLEHQFLPRVDLRRDVYLSRDAEPTPVLSIQLVPRQDPSSQAYFVFEVDSVKLLYAKAKVNNRSPLLSLLIEIELTFLTTTGEKVKQKSAPIALPPMRPGKSVSLKGKKLYSDRFTLNNTFSEISVRVVETNTAKTRLEDLQETVDTIGPDIKTLVQTFSIELLKAKIEELEKKQKELEDQPEKIK